MHLKSPIARLALRLGGALAFAVSLYFIYEAVVALEPGAQLARLDGLQIYAIVAYSLVYGASLSLLAIGWNEIARANLQVNRSITVIAYGRSVLAKYLPGSVFQYASRQVLGAVAGFEQKHIALSSMLEIVLHILVSAMVASLLIAATGAWIAPSIAIFGCCTIALAVFSRQKVHGLKSAMALQISFFSLFAAIAALVAYPLVGTADTAIAMAGIFLAAWLIGFLVPFAPGGIGIREAALLALGSQLADPATLLSYAALTRLVTLGGDLWFGLAAYFVPPVLTRLNRQASLRQ